MGDIKVSVAAVVRALNAEKQALHAKAWALFEKNKNKSNRKTTRLCNVNDGISITINIVREVAARQAKRKKGRK